MTDVQIALAEERVSCEGKEIILTPPSEGTRRDYTTYLEREAIEGMIRNRNIWGREYKETRVDLAQKIGLNLYAWGLDLWRISLDAPKNAEHLCFLIARQKQPGMTEAIFHDIYNFPDKVVDAGGQERETILGERIAEIVAGFINRPNSCRPATEPGAT